MADRASADRACKDPNPIIDGRKANVNLAYLGAKPRVIQPGEKLDHPLPNCFRFPINKKTRLVSDNLLNVQ